MSERRTGRMSLRGRPLPDAVGSNRPVAAGRRLANRAARYGVKRTFDGPTESLAETDRISLGRAFADYSPGRKSTAVRP